MLRARAGSFSCLNFLNAFAFTYPYSLPMMRGMGWGRLSAGGALRRSWRAGAECGGVLLERSVDSDRAFCTRRFGHHGARRLGRSAGAPTGRPLPETGTIRLATYNIHYGYDSVWHFTLEEIAQTIEARQSMSPPFKRSTPAG